MSRNAILATPEHYLFKIFWGSMPPDPLGKPKNFSRRCVDPQTFLGSTSPQTKKSQVEHWPVSSKEKLIINNVFKYFREIYRSKSKNALLELTVKATGSSKTSIRRILKKEDGLNPILLGGGGCLAPPLKCK